jgi:hypothetical protein
MSSLISREKAEFRAVVLIGARVDSNSDESDFEVQIGVMRPRNGNSGAACP